MVHNQIVSNIYSKFRPTKPHALDTRVTNLICSHNHMHKDKISHIISGSLLCDTDLVLSVH